MAGKPTLSRSKRLHIYHTSHEVTAAGSMLVKPTTTLTLHPQTNLVCSPEGAFTIRTTPTFSASIILNGNASIDGSVEIGGNLYVNGTMVTVASAVWYSDNTLGTAAGDTQKLVGTSLASGPMTVNGSLVGETFAHIKGNASLDGTLDVTGDQTNAGALHNKGAASLDSTLVIAGIVTANASVVHEGALHNKGAASLDNTLDVAGILTANASVVHEGHFQNKGNASIDGYIHYARTIDASSAAMSASLLLPDIPGVTGPVAGYTQVWNKTLATYMYMPYWTRT